MKFSHIVAAAALAFAASQAGAVSFTVTAAPASGSYQAFSIGDGIASVNGFATYTGDVGNTATSPLGDTGTYSVITTTAPNLTGTLTFAPNVTSYTFLWGSPDASNKLVVDGQTFLGSDIFGAAANGNNANSALVTFTDTAGLSSMVFTTNTIAFEAAQVTPVPEPETYALMLAGLGAIGWVARRRKSV